MNAIKRADDKSVNKNKIKVVASMHLVPCSRCEHCALIRIQKHRVNVHKSSNKKPREQNPGGLVLFAPLHEQRERMGG